jgi:CheY-like chemotaxis protein
MGKRVLTVGHCGFDNSQLAGLVRQTAEAEIVRAQGIDDALAALRGSTFDLVLVNRVFQGGSQSGLELIRRIKNEPAVQATHVMLVSNYAESQTEAVAAGAEPGFGKADMGRPETEELLRRYLA